MKIDIIDLTSDRYKGLLPEQLLLVRRAQVKKDAILAAADDEKMALFMRMLGNNVPYCKNWEYQASIVTQNANAEIENLKRDLDYQLGYPSPEGENEYGPYSYPDNPDYSLSDADRYWVVHDYYMQMKDGYERLRAYAVDTLAISYLGEVYQTLYERLLYYRNQGL